MATICLHHYAYYLHYFSHICGQGCSNMFGIHGHKEAKQKEVTHEISLNIAGLHKNKVPGVIPSKTLCITCWKKLTESRAPHMSISSSNSYESEDTTMDWKQQEE